jgi:hypothetical protein
VDNGVQKDDLRLLDNFDCSGELPWCRLLEENPPIAEDGWSNTREDEEIIFRRWMGFILVL